MAVSQDQSLNGLYQQDLVKYHTSSCQTECLIASRMNGGIQLSKKKQS